MIGASDPPPWHALPVEEALRALHTTRAGLTSDAARRRRAEFGPNVLPPPRRSAHAAQRFGRFDTLFIILLAAAAGIVAALGRFTESAVIGAVVAVKAATRLWRTRQTAAARAAVRERLSQEAAVLRDGSRTTCKAADLVPGDVVFLEAGDRVPADLRLIHAAGLGIEESVLTGDPRPRRKTPAAAAPSGARSGMAHSGTLVTAGRGSGVVVATGARTEIGRVGATFGGIGETTTPLLRRVDRLGRRVALAVLPACAALFAVAVLARGHAADTAFLAMVGVAAAAIPEGLPALIGIALAHGVRRTAGRHALVRRLPAVESLGAVTTLCTDKTGMLTLGEMVVRTVLVDPETGPVAVTGDDYGREGEVEGDPGRIAGLVRVGVLCNDAELVRDGAGHWSVAGDPMDGALLTLAGKAGVQIRRLRSEHPRVAEIPFDPAERVAATLNRAGAAGTVISAKGAAGRILSLCDWQMGPAGPQRLDTARWTGWEERLAGQGQRVLAFAMKPAGTREALLNDDLAGGFLFLGLAGFVDPPRPGAIAAVARCRRAGIAVTMITGDHPLTALAVAGRFGLDTSAGVLTGAQIDGLDDAALGRRAAAATVIARAAPVHKLRLVEALRAGGGPVAVTGDGIDDAPALARADVGVATGRKGSDAARDAADVVLSGGDVASVAAAIGEGRTVCENARKIVAWTLPTGFGEALVVVAAILAGVPLPVTPLQLLWISMVTGVALGPTLAFEPPERSVMERPPRPPNAPLLGGEMVSRLATVAVLMTLAAFGLLAWSTGRGEPLAHGRTLAVNAVVLIEVASLLSVRRSGGLSDRGAWRVTPAVGIGVAITLALQGLLTYAAPLQAVFGTRPLEAADLAVLAGVAGLALLVVEAERLARGRLLAAGGRRSGKAAGRPSRYSANG